MVGKWISSTQAANAQAKEDFANSFACASAACVQTQFATTLQSPSPDCGHFARAAIFVKLAQDRLTPASEPH